MLHVLVNYNFTPDWVKDKDYLIYDRSDSKDWLKDFDQSKIVYESNIGQVDFPKLSYLIENYDALPDVFLWGKSNLFKSISEEKFDKVKDNQFFTPLLTQNHKVYEPICRYVDGMYEEINNDWYVNQFEHKYCSSYKEFAETLGLSNPEYLQFCPGGNYILTKETVHKHPRELYVKMRNMLGYCKEPAEAQMCERSYYNLFK